jgi:hypothetical protein
VILPYSPILNFSPFLQILMLFLLIDDTTLNKLQDFFYKITVHI